MKITRILCDECGDTAYYGEAVSGFVSGKVYCLKCAIKLIKDNKAEEVD